MNSERIHTLQTDFDTLVRTIPEENVEFWFARDLMAALDYARWENFVTAIQRAITSCETMGYPVSDHFRGITKMIIIGKGGQREVDDFMPRALRFARHPTKSRHLSVCFAQRARRYAEKEEGV